MLPFVRMFEYGNIKPRIEIKDVKVGSNCAYVLYNNGQLFLRGLNQSGELGLGNTTRKTDKWYECLIPGVIEVHGGQNCTIIKTSNKIYFAGWATSIGIGGTGSITNYTSFQDITNLFSAFNFDNMKIVFSSRGVFVIDNNILYSIGDGTNASTDRYGNGGLGSTRRSTFFQVGTNVKSVYSCVGSSSEVSFYVTNDGQLYSTGRNLYGTCGLGYVGETPTFQKVTISAPVRMVSLSNGGGVIICTNGELYMVGSRTNGRSGDGSTSTANYLVPTKNTLLSTSFVNNITEEQRTFFSDYINTVKSISPYGAGADYSGTMGTGVQTQVYLVFTEPTPVIDFSLYKLVECQYFRILWNSGSLYYTGQSAIFDVGTPNFLVFTEITRPLNV